MDVYRGHGTYVVDDQVLASVAGTLERVNKLVSVKPLRTKYVLSLFMPERPEKLTCTLLATTGIEEKSEIWLLVG